ncbi:DNA primase [Candidatus Woesearchaeota archaeon]|nr:DNA primase [Candidatus Woesearchaeota archaeon]
MGKISPVAAKYIVHTQISIDGIVDRPDVIGAIFGQTEGLLGTDLELRELQRNGRIGRIEVKLDTKTGKTQGYIIIPSSLDKAETAIIGAALETIQRIGPCNAKVKVEKIEDVRITKRNYVIERAKELLKELTENVLPDSQEITDEVASSVRMMEIREYGRDRLPAGPSLDDSEEIIVVEGRADVLSLLKNGIKNVIAMNGTSVPETIKELCKKKVVTAFVDGDRGGDLIIRELLSSAEIDYVIKAPDGKEVEELTKKEIHKALRSKVAVEQISMEMTDSGRTERAEKLYGLIQERSNGSKEMIRPVLNQANNPAVAVQTISNRSERSERPMTVFNPERQSMQRPSFIERRSSPSKKESMAFKEILDDLIGTRGAYILDKDINVLGKVPTSELASTLKSLPSGVHAVVLDANIDLELVKTAERSKVKYLVANESRVSQNDSKIVEIITRKELS